MAYGTIKVDNITFDNGGVDKLITVSGLFYSTSGALTVTGAISGGSVTAPTATFTTLTGTTTAGTTATFTSGSFTSLTGVTTTVTSGIFASGTAAAPSITISGYLNTGIYSPGANQLAITTSGTGRITVDASGNVNIDSNTLYVDAVNNRVGIGVTPVELLDVAGNIRQTGNTAGTGNTVGLIDFYNTNSTTTIARINVRTDGATNSGSYRISTANAGTLNEVVRIDSSGRVGIGTTPDTILHTAVSQAGSAAVNIFKAQATNTTDNVITRLDLSAEPALGTASVVRLSAITGNAADSSNMAFNVRNGGVSIEALRISSVGNVGVGTTPTTKLDVAGSGDSELRLRAASDPSLIFSETTANKNWKIKPSAGDLYFQYSATAYNSGYSSLAVLTNSGRVGINTPSPGAHLSVNGNAIIGPESGTRLAVNLTENDKVELQVIDSTSTARALALTIGTTEAARIDSSGRLLVGTGVAGSSITKTIELASAGGGTAQPCYQVYSYPGASDINCGYFQFYKSRGATVGTNTIVASNDVLGQMYWHGANGTGYDIAASIKAEVDGTPGASNDMPGRLVFSTTADGAASPTERLRITNDGVRCYNQPTPATYAAAATLTVADLKTAIITYTGTAATLTLPTGTLTEGGFSGIYTNMTFEWSVINTGAGICTIGAGTAHTIVGSATVAIGASARFASRRTAANTFVSYRLS